MDGIQEASNQSDSAVSNASVSCVVALLGTLEDLSNGCGLSEENVEMLRKLKEPDNIQELSGNFSFKTKNIVGLVIQWFSINEFCGKSSKRLSENYKKKTQVQIACDRQNQAGIRCRKN